MRGGVAREYGGIQEAVSRRAAPGRRRSSSAPACARSTGAPPPAAPSTRFGLRRPRCQHGASLVYEGAHRPACGSCGDCSSYIDRTVYDGDQYLLEILREGSDTSQAATLENDSLPDVLAAPCGRVAYLNAGGLDKPLDVVRMEYNAYDPLFAFVPHENWRGLFDAGTFADGAGRMSGVTVNWQSQDASANYLTTRPYAADWHGSVIQDKREGSGALYMRSRYFDPATGRFTQEDPIGLAGGINLYGFAGGDPVNFSDPFGLMQCPPDCSGDVDTSRPEHDPEFKAKLDQAREKATTNTWLILGAVDLGASLVSGAKALLGSRAAVEKGIYEFTAASGKVYVGQSGNISQRLLQHVRSGKLAAADMTAVSRTEVLGGKTAREIAEQRRSNQLGGIVNLENKVNPIGPARQHLLNNP